MNRKAVIAGTAILLAAVVGGLYWLSYRGSPEYALDQVREAVEERNRLKFQNRVALDDFLAASVDQLFASTIVEQFNQQEETDSWGTLGTALGSATVEQLKPALVQTIRTEILDAVESGRLDSVFGRSDSVGQIRLDRLANLSGVAPSRFANVGEIQEEGSAALVEFGLRQPRLDTTLALTVRLEKQNDIWRVVRPEDLNSYLENVRTLRTEYLKSLNDSIRQRIRDFVQIQQPRRNVTRQFGVETVKFEIPIGNVSEHELEVVTTSLRVPSDTAEIFLRAETPKLRPSDSTVLVGSRIGSNTNPVPSSLINVLEDSLKVELDLVLTEGDSGRYLATIGSWSEYRLRRDSPQAVVERAREANDVLAQLSDSIASMVETVGPWIISEETDPLDDSKTVTLVNTARSGASSYGERPVLIIRCRNNETELYINWREYLGDDRPSVRYRVGEQSSQTRYWSPSTDNTASFYPGNDIAFIKQLFGTQTLAARVTPYNESPITAVFNVSSLSQGIEPLREACHW